MNDHKTDDSQNNQEQEITMNESVEEQTAEQVATEPSQTEPSQTEPEVAPLSELEQAILDRDNYLQSLQQKQAEFENYRKRTMREKAEWQEFNTANLIAQLLPCVDNFTRALELDTDEQSLDDFKQGVSMIHQQLQDFLTANKITAIPTELGSSFDPDLHQAMMQDTSGQYPAGSITVVMAVGYKMNDRVIRHSQVGVASDPQVEDTENNDEVVEGD